MFNDQQWPGCICPRHWTSALTFSLMATMFTIQGPTYPLIYVQSLVTFSELINENYLYTQPRLRAILTPSQPSAFLQHLQFDWMAWFSTLQKQSKNSSFLASHPAASAHIFFNLITTWCNDVCLFSKCIQRLQLKHCFTVHSSLIYPSLCYCSKTFLLPVSLV